MRLIRRLIVIGGAVAALWSWRETMLRRNEATWADVHQSPRN